MRKAFNSILIYTLVAGIAFFAAGPSVAKEKPKSRKNSSQLAKIATQDLETIDGNRIFNYIQNNGLWSSHNNPIGHGMEWPGRSGNGVDFASGIWVGGLVNGDIRTAAAEFSSEWSPGTILPDGTPDDPGKAVHQILKINKADLLDEGFNNPDYDVWINEAYLLGAPIERDENGNPVLSATGKRIPAIIGDQMIWNVYNDADLAQHNVFGSQALGLECQNTIFVFNRPDAFGDMMFMKFLFINKGGNTIEDSYVGVWFDVDLGNANDDLVFCDTTLSLGAFWNEGPDDDFPIPPAVGADFFQGPIVPSDGDTALVSGRKIPNFKNLGMTSFAKYINSGPVDASDPANALEVYNFMLGLNGLGQEVTDPTTGQPTKFVNVSDPETGTGWVDGQDLAAADRRMLMNSGPFTMEPWIDENGDGLAQVGEPGVQEVVVGWMVAQGTDAKNSATQLKRVDEAAQLAFDLQFSLPPSPPVPQVTVSNTDGEVVLTWADNAESYSAIDRVDTDAEGNPTFYEFQGYNIYQVDSPNIGPNTTILKLATFDIADGIGDIQDAVFSEEFGEVVNATVQRAPDTGLQRFFRVTTDALNGGVQIRNWQKFWFVVTAYGVNLNGIPKILESPFRVVEVVPQPVPGGVKGTTQFGEMIALVSPDTALNATHTASGPLSDGQLEVTVIDPTKVTGKDYQVTFEVDDATGELLWNLDRLDDSGTTRLLSRQRNQSGDEGYAVVDGLQVKSIGPPNSFKAFLVVANAAGPLDPPEMGAFAFNANGFPFFMGSDRPDAARQQTNGSTWGVHTGGTSRSEFADDGGNSFLERVARNDNFTRIIPFDFEMRFTEAGGFANWGFEDEVTRPVPFELWNIGINTPDDPSDDFRMIPWVLNDTGEAPDDGVYNINPSDHAVSGGSNDPYMDWVYWRNPADTSPGTAGYDAFVAEGTDGVTPTAGGEGSSEVLARTVLVNWNGGDVDDPTFPANVDAVMPEVGTVFRIVSTKPNTPSDVYTFSTAGFEAVSTAEAAQSLIDQINVFPNPYFGSNRAETDPVFRFVTFTHLPPDESVTIRIFTLSGEPVAVIDDARRNEQGTFGTQMAQWDLRNNEGVPAASGIYLVHIDMGSKGQKVLKLAVFQPQERLDTF